MKICPKCGAIDNPYWRYSRFDYDAEYMEEEEFQREYPKIWKQLDGLKTFRPVEVGGYFYYRRGKSQRYVYRVLPHDFKQPRK